MISSSTMGTEDEENMKFDSPEDEVAYCRDRYRRVLDMLDETRAELDDFQASSKELEDELERELSATETQQAELKDRIKRLEAEKDDWKAKLLALQKLHSSTTANMQASLIVFCPPHTDLNLQREMDNLRSERDKTLLALRELEMGNDELERNERVAVSSLLDLESKYNRAIEEKTLLEQEVIHIQDLEEERQRLRDELRDSSNEIAILRDRVARAVPTPPSSISVPLSPKQNASHRLSDSDVPRFPASKASQMSPPSNTPEPRNRILTGIPRSNTASSIPSLASPATKRFSSTLPQSPSGIAGLARSTTSRNLAAVAAPGSPAMLRSRSALSAPSPARSAAVNSSLAAKTKGFKLLHELQARLKATDDKLGTRMAKRNVSAPVPPAASLRTFSSATTSSAPQRVAHARVTALTKESTPIADQSGATLLSPNGWVLISESEETPTNQATGIPQYEPASPLESNFRPTSSTGGRGLPARPGIPSPLASFNTQLSQSSNSCSAHRPPSRASALGSSTMTPLKTDDENDSRPMSPSMRSQPSGSLMRSASPASGSASMPSSRPPSRQGGRDKPGGRIQHHVLGRGPPPSSPGCLKPLAISVSSSSPAAGLRRSARRSSLGVAEASLPPSGIPAPRGTANRPISLPVFGNSTPPPVPRIPSAHMRESVKRNGMLGASGRRERDRLKSAAE